jgi:hypothetical protein
MCCECALYIVIKVWNLSAGNPVSPWCEKSSRVGNGGSCWTLAKLDDRGGPGDQCYKYVVAFQITTLADYGSFLQCYYIEKLIDMGMKRKSTSLKTFQKITKM